MYTNISPTWLSYLIANSKHFILVDIRDDIDRNLSYIKSSYHIKASEIIEELKQLTSCKKTKIIIYDSCNDYSPIAATMLLKTGYHNISVLEGGLKQWISEQHPIETNTK
jgi:rhodanese-related sulfurtransferase